MFAEYWYGLVPSARLATPLPRAVIQRFLSGSVGAVAQEIGGYGRARADGRMAS
jgi:hypothetical protein